MPRPARHAHLKLLEGRGNGRDSGGRVVAPPPPFKRIPPRKPAGLTAAASQHWDQIVPELARLDLLTPVNVGALVILCETWARWQAAQATYASEGLFASTSQGIGAHPAVGIAERASREYRAWAGRFGLDPAGEGSLKPREGGNGDDDNPFARS